MSESITAASPQLNRIRLRYVRPPASWKRNVCHADGCRFASLGGNLCARHQQAVAEDVARDLGESGLDWSPADFRVSVTSPSLYLTLSLNDVRPRSQRQVHRVVMDALVGRHLLPNENVHHVNGCTWDNSRNNLELWASCQPSGQRSGDLAAYGRRLLGLYGTPDEVRTYGTVVH